jgi:tetratricopeptide (TPR) repeat protein
MKGIVLIVSTIALTCGGWAVWGRQRGALPSSNPAQSRARPSSMSWNPPSREVTERMEAAVRPSNEAERRARALLAQGDIACAEAECRKAVALSPTVNGQPTHGTQLLGEICLREGRNREALKYLLGALPHTAGGVTNLNAVIAFCRLGDYRNAKRFYSDGIIVQDWSPEMPSDLPGTRDLASLEASALLGHGIDAAQEHRREDALRDFLAAERLMPRNPHIAYITAETMLLLNHPGDAEAALPRYRLAAATGHGRIAEKSKRALMGLKAWFRLHPPTTPSRAGRLSHKA